MFAWITDKENKFIAIFQYIVGIAVVSFGLSQLIGFPTETSIYCSRSDDKCIFSQQIFNITTKKNKFNVSSIDSAKFDAKTSNNMDHSNKQYIQYDMVVSFNDKSKPFVYVLSPSNKMQSQIQNIEKSTNVVNNFNNFLTDTQQLSFKVSHKDYFVILGYVFAILIFIFSILWPIIVGRLRKK